LRLQAVKPNGIASWSMILAISTQIEALARARHPNNFFINAGDAILYEDGKSRYPKE
jgi:hypothetical protein